MRWASKLSRRADAADAFSEAADALGGELGRDLDLDMVLAFASPEHAPAFRRIAEMVGQRFPAALAIGCTGGGVIGDAREAEEGPALSLTGAALPGVALVGFHVEMTSLPPPAAGAEAWRAAAAGDLSAQPKLLLLADPFTMDARTLVAGLDRAYPGAPKFGGLAGGGRRPGENRLLLGGEVHRSGAVGVALTGDIAVDTIVAQGCRPIGRPMLVTRCDGGLLEELDQRPPLQALAEIHGTLGQRDRELMRHSLFLGLEMREERVEYQPGELLVRNIVAADERTGALGIGAELRPLQVVQFVLRDARTAEEDLRRMLARYRSSQGDPPAGALLFSCTGRGAGLFGRPDHDTSLFQEALGPAPLGGFFCNGEIGPVGGSTFLHGYTSAFALFRAGARPPPRR